MTRHAVRVERMPGKFWRAECETCTWKGGIGASALLAAFSGRRHRLRARDGRVR